MTRPVVHIVNLGIMAYDKAWQYQESFQQKLIAEKKRKNVLVSSTTGAAEESPGVVPSANPAGYLMFVEHPHVYTIGKSGNWEHLLYSDEMLKKKGIEVVQTNRGGDITYHGPGQLVGYPVIDLEKFNLGIARYIERLEEVIIRTTEFFGIRAKRIQNRTGVWVSNNKICALGIMCSRYVTMHGFALNIHPDLNYYNGIVPCGLQDGGVTSFQKLMDLVPDTIQIQNRIVNEFEKQFQCVGQYKNLL